MSNELAKQYQPKEVETEITDRWNKAKAFAADPTASGEPYAIVIPPPNVTAALHMGHALNNTLQDILIRYKRMAGFNTLWMPGTDHAGIATQTVVEKRVLQEQGKRRTDFERDEFVEKIQAWKDEYEKKITEQLQAMGCSCDWDRQRFTMDEVCVKAVREAFFKLFSDGLIYRGKRLVNWDPATQTALADDEVETRDIDGHFWYLKYPIVDQAGDDTGEFVTVATTRPETMLGDTAVAVNPKDTQHAKFIGKQCKLPIVNRIIPIIGDDYVVIPDKNSDDTKAQFASGFLKVTPAHDPNDWEIGKRHNLKVINIMAPDGSISKEHGWSDFDVTGVEDFANQLLGLDRYDARKAIVDWFNKNNLLAEVKPYRHAVGHSYRSHVAIEPYLSDQWYVKVTDDRLAGAALDALSKEQRSDTGAAPSWRAKGESFTTDDGGLKFFPKRYAKTFQVWHENIRDWCISRQLWWGHRIPVWWAPTEGDAKIGEQFGDQIALEEFAGRRCVCLRDENNLEIVKALEAAGYTQDPDVLDTWFSSALWPISTLGWPNPKAFPEAFPNGDAALEKWNPSSSLCTAREIITLWVSRMVMFNAYFKNSLPFKDVFIHAMIQDGHGQKMSKSLGNGVDPFDIIHGHGSDAMRFTLAAMTTQTQDVRMPVDMVCPHTGKIFTPKYVNDGTGHLVAAPIQDSPAAKGKKMVSSYGVASGKSKPTDEMPLARNTSEKFDYGRNFANKLWNAVRFALGNLDNKISTTTPSVDQLSLADRWILSRLASTISRVTKALDNYEFKPYADVLYHFIWRDFCDWYIESIKQTVRENKIQQRVLVTCIDAFLRLLHPAMPFITEKLFEQLNIIAPDRGVADLELSPNELLINAPWPKAANSLIDTETEAHFENLQTLVAMIREVRMANQVSPRETVDLSIKTKSQLFAQLPEAAALLETMCNVKLLVASNDVLKPDDAAAVVRPLAEVYLHGQLDAESERDRLAKRLGEVQKNVQALAGRLNNKGYADKAPAHLVQQTRDQLAAAEAELKALESQLAALA